MKIETVYDKGSRPLNEDSLLTRGNVFGVFDGATGHDGYEDETGKTGGYIAASIAQEIFFHVKEYQPLLLSAHVANYCINKAMQEHGIDTSDKLNLWCTTVSAVRIEGGILEWVQTGDSRIVLIYRDGIFKKLPNYFWDVESLKMLKRFTDQGIKNINALPEMEAEVKRVRRLANVTYGFLNGDPNAIEFLKYGIESLNSVEHILLLTDGMEIPQEDFSVDETGRVVELFLEGGLEHVKNHIRAIEDSDPECVKYIRFKPHDDMAGIALSFLEQGG